ncbi:calcium/proton exchanger [Tanacetum coccineum]|uniref:Calcium/proton exchanger n=1 Tax=Tanacetum coccineum TaxID=301880 RepID=A0ABQ5BN33_9ASTR
MLKVGYDNGFQIDMYVDHFGYDIMEMVEFDRNEELRNTRIKAELDSSDDDYHYSDDDLEQIENVDFHTEGDDSVVIKNITTQDPFLTKLCSARILFRGNVEYGVNEETPQVDPDDNQIDHVYKVKNGVLYPAFDPDIPWDKMEPILGMRFETPQQLKMALANYDVAHGYQLCKKGNKHRVLAKKVRTRLFRGDKGNQASKKPVKKYVKKKPVNKKPDSQSGECTKIIEDPFMPLRKMRDDIRQKFMIDVSVEQCMRAKQLTLFDHEGGLIEHYAKLYQYRQAIVDSNPGSTCTLDVVESDNGSVSFKRMYICFKGVKDGWLAGCRKVIGLDGCFFKAYMQGRTTNNNGKGCKQPNVSHCITIISDSHKGLIDAVNDWLPEAEHRKCTRHIYANFKKKYSGLQYQRLF